MCRFDMWFHNLVSSVTIVTMVRRALQDQGYSPRRENSFEECRILGW
jgi:hypothetical protein